VPEIAAAAIRRYLLNKSTGPEKIRDMMRDDIHAALNRGDKEHASELLMVLRHFLATHPEAKQNAVTREAEIATTLLNANCPAGKSRSNSASGCPYSPFAHSSRPSRSKIVTAPRAV